MSETERNEIMKYGILTGLVTTSALAVALTAFSQDRGVQRIGIEQAESLCVAQSHDGRCYAWLEVSK